MKSIAEEMYETAVRRYTDAVCRNGSEEEIERLASVVRAAAKLADEESPLEEEEVDDGPDYSDDDGLTDVEADAMTLASAGWGTDEDYGYYGGEDE